MTPLALTIGATALGWFAVFALFVSALRRRWFARSPNGFFLSMLAAMAGLALMSASVVGVWGYEAASRILDRQLDVELQDVGTIVDGEVREDLDWLRDALGAIAGSVAPLVQRGAPPSDVQAALRAGQVFNQGFVQIDVVDRDGRVLASTVESARRDDPGRVAIAFALDGKPFVSEATFSSTHNRQLVYLCVPLRSGDGPVVGAAGGWYDLQSELVDLLKHATFNESGYAVMVDGEGQVLAHPDPARINDDVSWYPAVQRARASDQAGAVEALNSLKQLRLFAYRRIANPATLAKQPWVLLTEVNSDERLAPLRKLRAELALGIGLVLLAGLIVAHQVSRSIQQPLHAISEFAQRVGAGDLTGRVVLSGRDVSARLAGSLNEMVRGLEERDHVKEVFGRYIATQVSDKILKGQVNLGGESRRVSILFSDIRNFTGMAEQMTPAQVVTFLNDYFSEMVEAVFEQDGMLDKFIGDGLMAVFGAVEEAPDHPRRAVLAALRMKARLAKLNGDRSMAGKPPIAIGIGIHSDEVVVGNIGSRKRLEYTVVGDGVNVSSRLQGLNKEFGTTILISETTFKAVQEGFECRLMPEAQLRGKTRELRFYEVLSVKAPAEG